MDKDSRLLLLIGLCLVGGILIIYGLWLFAEAGRPELIEVRVVTASASDPVFREGTRSLEPGEKAELAVALKLRKRGKGEHWIAPVEQLELDGEAVDHMFLDSWPEKDRLARVFWFTLESHRLGGELSVEDAAEKLAYQSFLIADAGRGLRVQAPVEPRNDDFLSESGLALDHPAGTLRFYARVEIVASMTQVKPLQASSSIRDQVLDDPLLPTLVRPLALVPGLSPRAGELFNLPGFEPVEGADPEKVTKAALGRSFSKLVTQRLVSSSRSFAAMAVAGSPEVRDDELEDLGIINVEPDRLERGRRRLLWGDAVRPGDLLELDGHWIVLLGDDGNGALGPEDPVAHCWHRSPDVRPLDEILGEEDLRLRHLRHAPIAAP